MKPVTSVA